MTELTQRQRSHFHTVKSILSTGSLNEREGRDFIAKYLENAGLPGEDRVQIRKAVVQWQAEQAKKEAQKRAELERQRRIKELEEELSSKRPLRDNLSLRDRMARRGWK